MKCQKCNADNPPDSSFCAECGAKLSAQCPKCGESLELRFKFCNRCGHDLSKPVMSPELTPSPSTPPAPSPAGDRRHATVLFSDLSGYTVMNEQLDPEDVAGIMRCIKAEAVKIVESHGGIVN
jgi:ribosomal protein L40E